MKNQLDEISNDLRTIYGLDYQFYGKGRNDGKEEGECNLQKNKHE